MPSGYFPDLWGTKLLAGNYRADLAMRVLVGWVCLVLALLELGHAQVGKLRVARAGPAGAAVGDVVVFAGGRYASRLVFACLLSTQASRMRHHQQWTSMMLLLVSGTQLQRVQAV